MQDFKEQLLAEVHLASFADTHVSSFEGKKIKKELEGESWSCRESRRAHRASSRWHRLQGKSHVRGKAEGKDRKLEELLEDTEVGKGSCNSRRGTTVLFVVVFFFLTESRI